MYMDENLRKSIIIEHYENPINKKLINDDSYFKINMNSPSCIDNLDFMLKIEDNIIKDVMFDGEACAISTSATSIMIKLLLNKTLEEIENLINNYENMIKHEHYDEDLLGEANCYDEIYLQQNRIGCATIPWVGLKKAIKEYKDKK